MQPRSTARASRPARSGRAIVQAFDPKYTAPVGERNRDRQRSDARLGLPRGRAPAGHRAAPVRQVRHSNGPGAGAGAGTDPVDPRAGPDHSGGVPGLPGSDRPAANVGPTTPRVAPESLAEMRLSWRAGQSDHVEQAHGDTRVAPKQTWRSR